MARTFQLPLSDPLVVGVFSVWDCLLEGYRHGDQSVGVVIVVLITVCRWLFIFKCIPVL